MLSQQESLEAMAGRTPDGAPLIYVSQGDYSALRKKYDELLKTVEQQKAHRWWRFSVASAVAVIVVAVSVTAAFHGGASAQVQPFGKHFYTANNVSGVRAANAFCMARTQERQMQPGTTLGASGLVFECVKNADELNADALAAAKKEAEPWQFTPSPEHRARCVELRDQVKQLDNDHSKDALETLSQVEKLDDEATALHCWSKP